MAHMTLVVLGIDGLDAAQVEHFDLDELRLETHGDLETFAHQHDRPHTMEVWPTVATGVGPSDHGISVSGTSDWSNPVVQLASDVVGPHLNFSQRERLGGLASRLTGADWTVAETDRETVFDGPGRFVHDWPGVHRSEVLRRVWGYLDEAKEADATREAFDRNVWSVAAEQFGWVRELLDHEAALVATHVHVLDAAGHVHGTDEDHYGAFYRKTADYVAEIRAAMADEDELLVLSDHGLTTPWTDDGDDEIWKHSWRAYSASTADSRPTSVFDARAWIEDHVDDADVSGTDVDVPVEQLRQLGYIE